MSGERVHELSTLSGPEGSERVHELLGEVWRAHPEIDEHDRIRFELAVVEVANNIAVHASGGRPLEFTVRVWVSPERLEARLEDPGRPFRADLSAVRLPQDELSESGRGLALARAAVHELHYHRAGEYNQWQIVRRRGGAGSC